VTELNSDRWRRLQPILDEVLDLPEAERRSRLDAACAGDPDLRADVEALLAADAVTRGVLDGVGGAFIEDALRPLESDQRPAEQLLPGARVAGRYRIVSLLGRGGMGEVYRADDLKLGQAVALKFLPVALEARPEYLQRLLDEAKLARQVSHPNVCRVYDVGEWHDRPFLSMEYIDGEDLASLITRIGHLPRQKALDVARQLCAGLDAAHQLGILHRDLKPSNVMVDGRGQARITDFGLAVASAQLEGRDARAGTPGYMAPEQLEGGQATARSDVYALGLVLYELFTGRRAFQASTVQELRRLQEESSPTNPSLLVENFDPAVERAILRCLEKDPALRPASARDVALQLPGGDPLAEALAAGETPSPELIAASGPEGVLRPAVAFGTLGATAAMLLILLLLNDRASTLGWVAWPRTPDALEDNARGMLERLGYDRRPVDRARIILAVNEAYRNYVRRTDRSPDRWRPLRDRGQLDAVFAYGQAERHLMPLNWFGMVIPGDPAPAAGDITMVTDLRGRLVWLQVQPPDAETPTPAAAAPDWARLLDAAGLEPAQLEPTTPTRLPPVMADARAAWNGRLNAFGDYPVRVEAAALHGRPVYFELVVPWDRYWDPKPVETRGAPPLPGALGQGLFLLFAFTVTIALMVRNWVSGRGDRRGAFRVAAAVFVLRLAVWIFGGHHVPAAPQEYVLAVIALGRALTDAAAVWCVYVALEPYARRLHPRLLVSWTRLLRGRFSDPLVGRDVLAGVACGTVVILFMSQLYVVIPHALGLSAPPPPQPFPMGSMRYLFFLNAPVSRTLLGGRYVVEAMAAQALIAFSMTLLITIFLLGLRMVLRRTWAVLPAYFLVGSTLNWPSTFSEMSPIGLACSFAGAAVLLWTLRFGLVGVLGAFVALATWNHFPITARFDTPFFGTGLVGVLGIAGLAATGAIVASRPFLRR